MHSPDCAHSELRAHNCLKRPPTMHAHPSLSQFNLQTCSAPDILGVEHVVAFILHANACFGMCERISCGAMWHKNTDSSSQTQTTKHLRDVRRARAQCNNARILQMHSKLTLHFLNRGPRALNVVVVTSRAVCARRSERISKHFKFYYFDEHVRPRSSNSAARGLRVQDRQTER